MKNYAIILAAGKGTRMNVETPKCLFPLLNKEMITYIVNKLKDNKSIDEIIIVIRNNYDKYYELFKDEVKYVFQYRTKGTGHAVKQALSCIKEEGNTLIINGDMPLIDNEIIDNLFEFHLKNNNDISLTSFTCNENNEYGRIVRNDNNEITKIIEYKDAKEEKDIKEVNGGLYLVNNEVLKKIISLIKKSSNKESYITDIVEIGNSLGYKTEVYKESDSIKLTGVNDLYSLSIVEKELRKRINKRHMLNGVNIICPETVLIDDEVIISSNVVIKPNTIITGKSKIDKNVIIGPNTEIENSTIGEYSSITHSLIKNSVIGKRTNIGPFAHIRNETVLGDNIRIGNFVEVKKSIINNETKISHLTYVGDTSCGTNVNWGCGTVTVNYDGKNKNKTIVGDNCFIGCNTNLIAPLEIGDNAFIAAGSTITENIPSEAFSIARIRQVTKEDYAVKYPYIQKLKGEHK